jgi:hypothetical protein
MCTGVTGAEADANVRGCDRGRGDGGDTHVLDCPNNVQVRRRDCWPQDADKGTKTFPPPSPPPRGVTLVSEPNRSLPLGNCGLVA